MTISVSYIPCFESVRRGERGGGEEGGRDILSVCQLLFEAGVVGSWVAVVGSWVAVVGILIW